MAVIAAAVTLIKFCWIDRQAGAVDSGGMAVQDSKTEEDKG